MKNRTLLKSLLLAATLLFSIGISNINADTYSYSFSAKVWSAYGDQTLNGVTWTASATGGSYWGYDATKGQQFGSASSPANPLNLKTSGISGTITSIKVSTSGASSVVATFSVSVGGTAFTCSGSTSVSITATNTTYEFTGSGSGQIVLSWSQTSSKALYIKDIQVTYTPPSTPTITATPETLSGMTYVVGNGPSAEQSFQISGSNLTNDITLTPSANIEISTGTGASFVAASPITLTQSSGTVAATTIYARLKAGLSAASYNETISATSGTTTKTITATGSVTLPTAATPTFSPAAGTYTSVQNVTISSTTTGASIYYTTDGSTPDNTKTQYTAPISVTTTTTIKAIAYATDYNPSAVATATYTINTAPTITVTEVSVPNFSTTVGNTQAQTVTVNATNLTADITVALTGTDAARFSVSPTTITQTGGSVSNATVTITYVPTAPGSHTATLTLSSTGATDVTRSLTGTATLAAPTANNATGVTKTGFTASWTPVTGATTYEVNVYTKTTGTTTLLSEDFSKFTAGQPNGSADGTDISTTLDTYTSVPGWTGSKVYQAGGTTKVGASSTLGYLVTPALDLSSGTITLSFKAMAWSGDATDLKIYLDDVLAYTQTGLNNTDYTLNSYTTTLTGGTATSKIKFEGKQASKGRFFLDDVIVTTDVTKAPVTGSPFMVSAPTTSQAVTGLSNLNTYYYTVTAKNGTYSSPVSNETTVGLLSRVANPNEQLNLWSVGNKVYFRAAAGEAVELFNVAGQKIVSRIATDGINEITVSSRGIVFVKAGNRTGKVLIQ